MQYIKVCGLAGSIIMFLTVTLALITIIVAAFARGRRAMAVLAIVALLPLGVGLLGTASGYRCVNSRREEMETTDPAAIEHGEKQAWCSSYLGSGSTLLLWIICGIGAAGKGKQASKDNG